MYFRLLLCGYTRVTIHILGLPYIYTRVTIYILGLPYIYKGYHTYTRVIMSSFWP